MDFGAAHEFVARWEGGFVHHPKDPGGATNFGVTQRVYNKYRRKAGRSIQSVKGIGQLEVDQIYHYGYWLPAKCDKLPGPIALIVYDGSVNQGVRATARLLQAAASVVVDGKVGPKTLSAVCSIWDDQPSWLIVQLCARRARRYGGTKNFRTFGLGWMRRLCAAECAALEMLWKEKSDGE